MSLCSGVYLQYNDEFLILQLVWKVPTRVQCAISITHPLRMNLISEVGDVKFFLFLKKSLLTT